MVHRLTPVFLLLMTCSGMSVGGERIVLGVNDLTLTLTADARIISVVRRGDGRDLRTDSAPVPFLILRTPNNRFYADRCLLREDSLLVMRCSPLNAEFTILFRTLAFGAYVEVLSAGSDSVLQMDLFNLSLDLPRSDTAAFGVCLMPLTLHARSAQSPVLQDAVRGSVYRKFGMNGASWLFTAGPPSLLKKHIANALTSFPQMPHSPFGGPFADTSSYARGSYVMSYGSLTAATMERWTSFMRSTGFDQVQFHGGTARSFRFGGLEPDRRSWPKGWDSYRALTDGLRRRGIASTLHTYAFLIDTASSFVSPVPDPDLAVTDTFRLQTECLPSDPVVRIACGAGEAMSAGTLLRLGDELLRVNSVRCEGSVCTATVERGVFGTRIMSHGSSSMVHVLLNSYGLLCARPGSALFREIAQRHADAIAQGGFDGVYLDAIDAADRFGEEEGWYWASLFIVEIWQRLRRPVPMDMGAMSPHFWRFRTRWEAWDTPSRGYRRTVDAHVDRNANGTMLPPHLGWWMWEQPREGPFSEAETPSDLAYLLARARSTRAGISFVGEPPFTLLEQGVLRWKYDLLRNAVPECITGVGTKRTVHSSVITLHPGAPVTIPAVPEARSVTISVQPRLTPDTRPLTSVRSIMKERRSKDREWSFPPVRPQPFPLVLRKERRDDWYQVQFTFSEPLDLSRAPAFNVRLRGDSSNTILSVRIECGSPVQPVIIDRFIRVDFNGERTVPVAGPNYQEGGSVHWPMMLEASWRYFRGAPDLRNVRSLSLILGGRNEGTIRIEEVFSASVHPSRTTGIQFNHSPGVSQRTPANYFGEKIEFLTKCDYVNPVSPRTVHGAGNFDTIVVHARSMDPVTVRLDYGK